MERRREPPRLTTGVVAWACAALVLLPGCVVRDMHRDLAATRAGVERLAEVTPQLRAAGEALQSSNEHLAQLYEELAQTHRSLELILARLDTTNGYLRQSVEQLGHLEPAMTSLKSVDESLASLRKTIENIGKAIPMLNLSNGTPPADRSLQRQEQERSAEGTPPGSRGP